MGYLKLDFLKHNMFRNIDETYCVQDALTVIIPSLYNIGEKLLINAMIRTIRNRLLQEAIQGFTKFSAFLFIQFCITSNRF